MFVGPNNTTGSDPFKLTLLDPNDPLAQAWNLDLSGANQNRSYTVQRGDTLSEIAEREYGSAFAFTELARANGIDDPQFTIRAGQELVLPALSSERIAAVTPEGRQVMGALGGEAIRNLATLDYANAFNPDNTVNPDFVKAVQTQQLRAGLGDRAFDFGNQSSGGKAVNYVSFDDQLLYLSDEYSLPRETSRAAAYRDKFRNTAHLQTAGFAGDPALIANGITDNPGINLQYVDTWDALQDRAVNQGSFALYMAAGAGRALENGAIGFADMMADTANNPGGGIRGAVKSIGNFGPDMANTIKLAIDGYSYVPEMVGLVPEGRFSEFRATQAVTPLFSYDKPGEAGGALLFGMLAGGVASRYAHADVRSPLYLKSDGAFYSNPFLDIGIRSPFASSSRGAGALVETGSGSAYYQSIDSLGRPSGVYASITPDMIMKGSPANRSITPPGWAGDGRRHNQARGHLLGNQLGGSGDLVENLVTLQQNWTNSPVMRGFEGQVRSAVEAGQVVQYSSVPIYHGNNLIPKGVTLIGNGSNGFDLAVTVLNPIGFAK
jgi:LysM repeat protein